MKHRIVISQLLLLWFLAPAQIYAGDYLTFSSPDPIETSGLSVEIEGQSVSIVDFFQVDSGSENSPFLTHPAGRRQFFFLFDLVLSRPEGVIAGRKTALEFLQKAGKFDLLAVAGITPTGLKVYCAPTADRNQFIVGLNAIGKDRQEGMTHGPEGNYYPATFAPNSPAQQLLEEELFMRNLKQFALGEKKKDEYSYVLVQGLVDFAYALSTLHGRKNILFFTSGFETKGISLNLDLDERRSPSAAGPTPGSAPEPASLDSITTSVRDLEALANQGPGRRPRQHGAEVIPDLYEGIDARVHVVHHSSEENGFLKDLSEKTEGSFFQNTCDVEQVLSNQRTFYVVQWKDPERNEWKALNSVKISAEGRKITGPGKWLLSRPAGEQTAEEKRMHLAESVYKDFSKPPQEFQFWADFVFTEGKSKIPSFIQIPGSELLKYGEKNLQLEFYSYALSRDGSVLDSSWMPIELDLSNASLRERISSSGLKVWNVLLGAEKPLTIRCIIIHGDTRETITHSVYLEVEEGDLTMSHPFVPATNLDWIVWPKPMENMTRRGVQVHYPYRMGQDFFFPDLAPVIKPGAERVVYFRLYNILPESKNPLIRFHLMDARGQSVEIEGFHLRQKPKALEHAGMELFWNLTSLPPVEPGAYKIKIGVMDPVRKQFVVREVRNLNIPSS